MPESIEGYGNAANKDNNIFQGHAWVAQWVEHPTLGFGSGPDLRVMGSNLAWGSTLSMESLLVLLPLLLSLSLSLSFTLYLSKINK